MLALWAAASTAHAQRLDLWLNAGASHARPPGTVTQTDPGTYGLIAARARLEEAFFAVDVGAHGGRGTGVDPVDRWLGARGTVGLSGRLGRSLAGLDVEAFGLRYTEPFRYDAYGAALAPSLRLPLGGFAVSAAGALKRGRWRTRYEVEVPDPGGPPFGRGRPGGDEPDREVVETDGSLAVSGGSLRLGRGLGGAAWLELELEGYDAANGAAAGTYTGVGGRLVLTAGRVDAVLGGRWWRSPDTAAVGYQSEFGYRADVRVALDAGLSAYATVGRTVSDPLYGTSGAFAAGAGVSWHIGGARERVRPSVAAVGEPAAEGRRVRFRYADDDAERVAIAGDFSDWRPLPMERRDGAWSLSVTLPPGLHHFAFLVDGEHWVVPDEAPGIVEDGWGRRNASIVVEP